MEEKKENKIVDFMEYLKRSRSKITIKGNKIMKKVSNNTKGAFGGKRRYYRSRRIYRNMLKVQGKL